MNLGLKIAKYIFLIALTIILLVTSGLYIALSLPIVQNKVRDVASAELTKALNTDVEIGSVMFVPFDKVTLRNVVIRDAEGDTAAYIRRLGAGVELSTIKLNPIGIKVKYAELIGLDARINKATPESALNIQHIIDALKPKDKTKPPTLFNLKINSVIIRRSQLTYDVLSLPHNKGKLDPNHIKIQNLNTDIHAPQLANDDFTVELKRFTVDEQSGISIKNLTGKFDINPTYSEITDLHIQMPESELNFADLRFEYNSLKTLSKDIQTMPLNIIIEKGSHISLNDLAGLVPQLRNQDTKLQITADVAGKIDSLAINTFELNSNENNIHIGLNGYIGNVTNTDSLCYELNRLAVTGYGIDIADLVSSFTHLSDKAALSISNLGNIAINGNGKGDILRGAVKCDINSGQGNLALDVNYARSSTSSPIKLNSHIASSNINVGHIINSTDVGAVGFDTNIDATLSKHTRKANIEGAITHAELKGYRYNDILVNVSMDNNLYDGSLNIADPNINLTVAGEAVIENSIPTFDIQVEAHDIALDSLNLWHKYPGYRLSASIDAQYSGKTFDDATALFTVSGLNFINDNPDATNLQLDHIDIEVDNATSPQHIAINSDLIEGRVDGSYSVATLANSCIDILANSFPIITQQQEQATNKKSKKKAEVHKNNNFDFAFTVKDNNALTDFLNTPIKLIHPIYINGHLNHSDHTMGLSIDAPYLQKGFKLIRNTALNVDIANADDRCNVNATITMPSKKGDTTANLDLSGKDNRIDTDLSWSIDNTREFKGNVSLSAQLDKADDNSFLADIDINKSQLVFNDTAWTVNPAEINVIGNYIKVDGIDIRREGQFITINGEASPNMEHQLLLDLNNVNLDYVFQTLAINNVTFGGNATGTFFASNLFSKQPILYTPKLDVKGFSYNGAVFGDAILVSKWNTETQGVEIVADIAQANGLNSQVIANIYPIREALDVKFDANKLNAQFMRPIMSTFAKDISGTASGKAHLYGTFKDVNMTGDIYAENLRLKIDFTNVYYTASDSIRIRPGRIEFNNVKLNDDFGNPGHLTGTLRHNYFRDAEFDFDIHDVRNLLCYDETRQRNERWYGRIFGTGRASITGRPGFVGISVDMATERNSDFTFVILDSQEASEYSFVTFRDRNRLNEPDEPTVIKTPMDKVKQLEAIIAERQKQETIETEYRIDIHVNATPQADVTVIMDPAGGDRIRAHGNGSLQLTYDSSNEELIMNGTYRLEDGRYNFTLQDIILKEFTIEKNSAITFKKDPFNAILDLTAYYTLNANLSDLDESFLQDKDLNRTNVPVRAVLKATGNMQQPDIAFDIDFPTLSQDVYRKVKSIVSTDDMMNRQIIYLLALNRFYTPEYMASTTKGSELLSVATSTISSQLSSILGEINDNFNISPNFRSNKGDFSDLEVDLALSSRLLNNRLLFNGNFGYRDNSLNNNTFIGDFDIEYLLTNSGNIRLKAYNRYNDQNYYVKTALTTQGVGIVYRRDFDNMFKFTRKSPTANIAVNGKNRPVTKVNANSIEHDTVTTDTLKYLLKPIAPAIGK